MAIVGASSLKGKELTQVLEERNFPANDIRLLDEDVAVGTLTEAGGEPVIIGGLAEDSFENLQFAFFAGSAENTSRHWRQAHEAGAIVIDMSGPGSEVPGAVSWVPDLDAVLPPPEPPRSRLFRSPAPAAIVACSIAAALARFPVERLAMVFFQSASERGQPGIEELEKQTIHLLSFKPISQEVYDAQVAFNLLGSYGAGSAQRLGDVRAAISRDVAQYLAGRVPLPAIQLIQAPVFYGYAFTVFAELATPPDRQALEAALASTSIKIQGGDEPAPSNVSVAGESQMVLARVEADPSLKTAYWFWGAADNLRLAAVNAVRIAEKLFGS